MAVHLYSYPSDLYENTNTTSSIISLLPNKILNLTCWEQEWAEHAAAAAFRGGQKILSYN